MRRQRKKKTDLTKLCFQSEHQEFCNEEQNVRVKTIQQESLIKNQCDFLSQQNQFRPQVFNTMSQYLNPASHTGINYFEDVNESKYLSTQTTSLQRQNQMFQQQSLPFCYFQSKPTVATPHCTRLIEEYERMEHINRMLKTRIAALALFQSHL